MLFSRRRRATPEASPEPVTSLPFPLDMVDVAEAPLAVGVHKLRTPGLFEIARTISVAYVPIVGRDEIVQILLEVPGQKATDAAWLGVLDDFADQLVPPVFIANSMKIIDDNKSRLGMNLAMRRMHEDDRDETIKHSLELLGGVVRNACADVLRDENVRHCLAVAFERAVAISGVPAEPSSRAHAAGEAMPVHTPAAQF